jgi:hypothetical protein
MGAVGWRSDGRESRVAGGGAASGGARWQAGAAARRRAPKRRYRARNKAGKAPKERGRHKEFTELLVEEGRASAEEIDGEGGAPARFPWGRWCRGEEELRGVVRVGEVFGPPYIGLEREKRGRPRWWAASHRRPPLMARWSFGVRLLRK